MARDNPNVTILRGLDEIEYHYAEAGEAIAVGNAVELSGGNLQNASTDADEAFQPRFCIESRERGMVADDPDGETDNYDAGQVAKFITVDGGERLYLNLAAGEVVGEDDKLTLDGNGYLRAYDAGTDPAGAVVVEAREDVDATGAGDYAKIRVEVLA